MKQNHGRKIIRCSNPGRTGYSGFSKGYDRGYNRGYDCGYQLGWQTGLEQYKIRFDGISIVIPHYDKRDYLQECIESIQELTHEPYEIIVIDNGSGDGSIQYLQSLSGIVRYKACQVNLGFAGAVNQGLRMARGSTLLILNNDTVVTKNWLSNLLTCLQKDPSYGIVGPVTNYISGEQLIETNYNNINGMHEFACSYNRSDSARWTVTGRLTGFCMIMKRETFERLGYFDEGYEIGNCEDDDYGLRTRLLGLQLIIAKDTFIHHYGSVSMKALDSRFDQVYEKNLLYYSMKWGDPHSLLAGLEKLERRSDLRMVDFYPTHMTVRGPDAMMYWIEGGLRHPIENTTEIATTRVSQVDLSHWPLGRSITAEEWLQKTAQCSTFPAAGPQNEGCLVETPDHQVYQLTSGKLHKFITEHALKAWNLEHYRIFPLSQEEKNQFREGLPIIAPPILKADNI